MSVINKLVDKITSGPQAQYILGGALVVIIGLSLASVFLSSMKRNGPSGPTEWHAYCLETNQEFIIDPTDPTKQMGPEGYPPEGMMDGLVYSPYTKKRTAVMMTQCPNCKKFFVPDYMKDALERQGKGAAPMMMPPPDMDSALVCPYCQTDIVQWYRDHRKKR